MKITIPTLRSAVPAALLLVLTTGCATPTALKPEIVAKVNQTHVRAYLPEKELQSNSAISHFGDEVGIGGLVGTIVDAVVNGVRASANVRAAQLCELTRDVEIHSLYWQTLSNAIPTHSWLRPSRLDTFDTSPSRPTKAELTNSAVLDIVTAYYLSEDRRRLIVSASLSFYLPGKSTKPVGANSMVYHSTPIGRPELVDAISFWTTNNAAAFRHAIAEGMAENAKLVQHVLDYMGGVTNSAARPAKIRTSLIHTRDFAEVLMQGIVLEDTPDRLLFQAERGACFSFPRHEVKVQYTLRQSPEGWPSRRSNVQEWAATRCTSSGPDGPANVSPPLR